MYIYMYIYIYMCIYIYNIFMVNIFIHLKDKKGVTITNAFQKILKESN